MLRTRLVIRLLHGYSPNLFLALLIIALFTSSVALGGPVTTRLITDPEGENNADFFGTSVAWIGDVNVDGYDDLLVGAFRYPEIGSIGRVYLYFGGPALDAVADLVINPPSGGAGWFGISVASAGDFNGDNYPDFIVGARQAGYEGRAFIYYGGPSLDTTPDLTLIGESTGALTAFGASVASAGDLNADSFDDVIVGAPQYGGMGRAYVFFGGAVPDVVPDRIFTAIGAYDELGDVVGSAGDMNGDGYHDVFASAPSNDTPTFNAGAIYIWFGGPGFDTAADITLHGSGMYQHLMNAANAGDVNDDGFSDLIASEKDHVYLWFGGSFPNATPDFTFARTYASVAGAGDVNGDGIGDFVIGAQYQSPGGRVSVFFGGSNFDSVEDLYFAGEEPGISLGQGVAGGGRVDGPGGPSDLIATSYYDPDATGYNRGRVFVYANAFATTEVPETPTPGLLFMSAWPNPARNDVHLDLALDRATLVCISVYDVAGHEVARPIVNEVLDGQLTRLWRPQSLPNGIYYVNAKLGASQQVRKLIWMGH